MRLAKLNQEENATGARTAGILTVVVVVLGIAYFAVLFVVAR